ncbi:MAG TPA: phosphate ABC transporter permease PstA [Actinomycetales bacterium]|nr:phosphate ABC transporter permease PstA [Actinomycetales bacterium]
MSQATPDLQKPAKRTETFHPISGGRRFRNNLATGIFAASFILAVIPLVALLWTVISNGLPALFSFEWWTSSLRGIDVNTTFDGGVGHAIYGTFVQAIIAAVFSVPIGILTGIMLVEYSDSKFARPTSYMVDILAGVPSIVAALFIFGLWIMTFGNDLSAFAVALALVLLMLPVVIRSTEEMLKLVPDELREAAWALGIPKWKTIVSVVIPTAISGMISGIFIALARVMGETAPVLILVGYTARYNYDLMSGNMVSLPLLIKVMRDSGSEPAYFRLWGAALTLIIIIGLFNVLAAFASKALAPKTK